MNRPTAAFLGAAAAAVALSAGVSYAVVPEPVAELSVTAPQQQPKTTESATSEELHKVRVYPNKQGALASPFLPEHPAREQSKAAHTSAAAQKPGGDRPGRAAPAVEKKEIRAAPAAEKKEILLVGIVSSETGRRAILSVGKRQITLSAGEEKNDVTLVSLTEDAATVSTPSGVRVLSMGAGREQ